MEVLKNGPTEQIGRTNRARKTGLQRRCWARKVEYPMKNIEGDSWKKKRSNGNLVQRRIPGPSWTAAERRCDVDHQEARS